MQPQGPWAQPPQPQGPWAQPPQQGFAPNWMPADAGLEHQRRKLDDELQTWLILCAVGWFSGLLFIVGPAAWWKAGDLTVKYQSLRAPVPGNVGALRLVGILTSALCVLMVLAGIAAMMFFFVYAARFH